MLGSIVKDPDATLPYSVGWASPSGTNEPGDDGWLQGSTLWSSDWIVEGPDNALVVGSSSYSGTMTTVVLSGGTPNSNYTLTNRITYSGGQYGDDRSLTVKVSQR